MAVINVSAQEMKKGIPLNPKWYPCTIKEIKAEPTKDKSGINYNLYLTIDDGSKEGREFKHTINEHAKGSLREVWEAALSTSDHAFKINVDEDYAYDTDDVAGKPMKVKIVNDTYQGNITNKVKGFLPGHVDTDNIPY